MANAWRYYCYAFEETRYTKANTVKKGADVIHNQFADCGREDDNWASLGTVLTAWLLAVMFADWLPPPLLSGKENIKDQL